MFAAAKAWEWHAEIRVVAPCRRDRALSKTISGEQRRRNFREEEVSGGSVARGSVGDRSGGGRPDRRRDRPRIVSMLTPDIHRN